MWVEPQGESWVITGPVIEGIMRERKRQDDKWGDSRKRPVPTLAVLVEEVGEVAQAMQERNIEEVKEELFDVAAVAVAMLEGYYRGDPPLT